MLFSQTAPDSTSEGIAYQTKQIKRVTWIGLIVNLGLALLKFAVGFLGNSQAVIADAVHSLSDMITDFAVLFGVKFWSAPADDNHPYGHGRIESMITIVIGLMLFVAALEIGYASLSTIQDVDLQQPKKIALLGALFSIVLKEAVYRWTFHVGKRLKSPALMANAWHHRSDALSSIPAFIAVATSIVNPAWAFVDHLGAFVVSLFLFKVAWDIVKPTIIDLTDCGVSQRDRAKIQALALEVDGVKSVHRIRTRKLGYSFFVDLHVLVDGNISVREGHDISERVQRELIARGPDIVDAIVHIEPYNRHELEEGRA